MTLESRHEIRQVAAPCNVWANCTDKCVRALKELWSNTLEGHLTNRAFVLHT